MNEHDKFYDKELPYMIINWTNIKNRTVLERYEERKCILQVKLLNDKWVVQVHVDIFSGAPGQFLNPEELWIWNYSELNLLCTQYTYRYSIL